ncbi:MAG TPA: PH domain-containing protein [Haliangiales bacterium]|nr:PH domain-containing protein [Haliangiales bacterium]
MIVYSGAMRYSTKVDRWVFGVVGAAFVVELGAAVALVATMKATGVLLALLSLGTFVGIIRLAAWPVIYDIGAGEIRVRCGLWGFVIPIDGIVRVFPSRNPLSAPAWSLDRLQIEYVDRAGRKRMALLSPTDRDAFVAELAESDRGLQREDAGLARRRG